MKMDVFRMRLIQAFLTGFKKIKMSYVGAMPPFWKEFLLMWLVSLRTAGDVRLASELRFAFLSRPHIIQLKTKLQTLKKGTESIIDYIQKIKHISDSLAYVSCPVDDEDLMLYTLNGLPSEYGPFKTSICTWSSPITIEDFMFLFCAKN